MATQRLGADMVVHSSQRRYLRDQFHGLVLQATVQRADIYAPAAENSERESFRVAFRRELDDASGEYASPVREKAHIARIVAIADNLSRQHGIALRGGRFRIGPAQKALNLFLKYQWCSGWISIPPHCPFDALIISCLPLGERINWTQLDTVTGYESLVKAARQKAGKASLAEWELELYDSLSVGFRRRN